MILHPKEKRGRHCLRHVQEAPARDAMQERAKRHQAQRDRTMALPRLAQLGFMGQCLAIVRHHVGDDWIEEQLKEWEEANGQASQASQAREGTDQATV